MKINITKKHYLLFACSILVLLGLLLFLGVNRLFHAPWEKNITWQYPSYASSTETGAVVIENAGKDIVLLDANGAFLKRIQSTDPQRGFSIAHEVALDDTGRFYVLDEVHDENAKYIVQERLLQFDAKGNFERILYRLDADPHLNRTKPKLLGLTLRDNVPYFVHVAEHSYTLELFEHETHQIAKTYRLQNAIHTLNNVVILPDFSIYYTTMQGDIWHTDKGKIYDARTYDTKDYHSIAWDLACDKVGNLYFTDIGLREIVKRDSHGKITRVLPMGGTMAGELSFTEAPICYNISILQGDTILTAYGENTLMLSLDGKVQYDDTLYPKSSGEYYKDIIALVCGVVLALVFFCLLIFGLAKLFMTELPPTARNTILVSAATIDTMITVMSMTVSYYNKNYQDELLNKMSIVANLLGKGIDEEAFENLSSPSDYYEEDYLNIQDTIDTFFKENKETCENMFCVMYKVDRDVISIVYHEDRQGVFYPYDWPFAEGYDEYHIYETGETLQYPGIINAEGGWMFVLGPVYDSEGNVEGLIEVGTDLTQFAKESRQLTFNIILTVLSIIMTLLLLSTEFINVLGIFKKRQEVLHKEKNIPILVEFVRPIVFIIFFCTNMATSFLPVYAQSLELYGLDGAVASALVMSAEVFWGAIAGVVGGYLIDRLGVRKISVIGCIIFTVGLAGCGFTRTIYELIGANSLVGIGGGLMIVAINTYIACFDTEEKGIGFANFSAACLSGLNCGVIAGSQMAERMGYKMVFILSGVISVFAVLFILKYIMNMNHMDEKEENRMSTIKFLFSPRVLLYFIGTQMPYLIASYFILYFFPIFASEHNVSPTIVAQAFLLQGIIVIYFGPMLSDLTGKYLGQFKSVISSRVLYLSCFFLFVLKPDMTSCFIIAGIMGLADSFGFTAQAVYFTDLEEVDQYGEGKSLGINSAFENIAQTVGPFVFAGAMLAGEVLGMTFLGICFGILLFLFAFGTIVANRKHKAKTPSPIES